MTRIAYRVDDVPKNGAGAFLPAPAMTPSAATCGVWDRRLQQWTAAPPPGLRNYNFGSCSDNGMDQGSYANPNNPGGFPANNAPAAFVPGGPPPMAHHMAYWNDHGGYGEATMKRVSDNPLPVPAVNPGRTPVPAMKVPPFGTVISTAWPRPFISWPSWGSSRQQ